MRLFMASLVTETNTFAPLPTGLRAYEDYGIFHGDASRRPGEATVGAILAEWRRLGEGEGLEVLEGLSAYAQPAGRTLRAVYEAFRDEILDGVRASLPLDAVLLVMHGSMAAEGYDDCEGDLLSRIRAIVGPGCVVGAELDLHCNVSPAMLGSADVLVAFKEYPHTDMVERCRELYRICVDGARGLTRPVMRAAECRMTGSWRTTVEPVKGFVRRMQALEGRDGILSVSFGHCFPWADVADVGAKVWVVADGDAGKAAALAAELAQEAFALREAGLSPAVGIDQALDEALAFPGGPVVLADVADNPGGGAPGDSTFILRRLLERGVRNVATGCYWDLGAIEICRSAGVGAAFRLRIGGKCGVASGDPVDLDVTVRAILDNHVQDGLPGLRAPLGTSVWVEAEGIDIVLSSLRSQVFTPDAFTALGIGLQDRKLVVVKSIQHFHAGFAPIAAKIGYVSTPGALQPDFAAIPYTKHDGRLWPRVADPFR